MKSKLVALIIGIGLMLCPSIGRTQSIGHTISGEPVYANPGQEKRDKQRFEWETEDRHNQKKMKEEQETRAQDARRESAYKESKAAHRAKVKKMRKAARSKPFNSWQLNH
ncbi:MAG: hypothetical protein M0P73_15610 [Syntrophobacterales bacterium]|nr:hypothetical protein [Syntrophobacterales bacterium]